MATNSNTPTQMQVSGGNNEQGQGSQLANAPQGVGSYRETRLNLVGVPTFKVSKGKNDKGIDEETVTAILTDDGSNYVTEDINNMVEGSKAHKELLERLQKAGLPEPQIAKQQTFEYSEITDPDQIVPYFVSLGLDEAQARKSGAAIFQRGWAIAQQVEIRGFMSDTNQAEIAGVTSVASEAAQPGERRQKDPMVAAAANLKKAGFNLTPDDLRAFLATLNPASQAA